MKETGQRALEGAGAERAAAGSVSRRGFLGRSGAVALAAGSSVLVGTMARPARADDNSRAASADYFKQIQEHENAHVTFLVEALGRQARPKPTFVGLVQASYENFVIVSQVLENTGVAAYAGAAPYINNRDFLAASAAIALIEARHAGFLNYLQGSPVTANALNLASDNDFETPLSGRRIALLAGPFVKSLNGGPGIGYSGTPSDANDIAILNFALALEYLEQEFYNLNVPIFID